jgi:hypothetical protein
MLRVVRGSDIGGLDRNGTGYESADILATPRCSCEVLVLYRERSGADDFVERSTPERRSVFDTAT